MSEDRSLSTGLQEYARRCAGAGDGPLLRLLLILITWLFLSIAVLLPLSVVFAEAFARGSGVFLSALVSRETLQALGLTLTVTALVVPANMIFGLSAAWALTKFEFPGKPVLLSLIDLPFAVSPVIVGYVLVLVFGSSGWLGPVLSELGVKVLFSTPGIVLATIFVTFPMVARPLIALMEDQGREEEETALSLGAGGLRTFLTVTLPNVRWALFYGGLLCAARSFGEFGAVSVVSGHIRGLTNTMPLHVEALYNDNRVAAAFAVASLLASFSLFTLILKFVLERKLPDDVREAERVR